MSVVEFLTIVLALGLGIPIGTGITYLLAWLIVNHQERMEKLRRKMSSSSYRKMRRRNKLFLVTIVVSMIFVAICYYYWNFACETTP